MSKQTTIDVCVCFSFFHISGAYYQVVLVLAFKTVLRILF